MDPRGLPSRALPWCSAKRSCALPSGLCWHGHPLGGKNLLESGLPGWARGSPPPRNAAQPLRQLSGAGAPSLRRAAAVTFRQMPESFVSVCFRGCPIRHATAVGQTAPRAPSAPGSAPQRWQSALAGFGRAKTQQRKPPPAMKKRGCRILGFPWWLRAFGEVPAASGRGAGVRRTEDAQPTAP